MMKQNNEIFSEFSTNFCCFYFFASAQVIVVLCSLLFRIDLFFASGQAIVMSCSLFIELIYFFAPRQAIVLIKQNNETFFEFSTNSFSAFVFFSLVVRLL